MPLTILSIGSREESEGISSAIIDETGRLEFLKQYPCGSVSYMCNDNNVLYVLLREPFFMSSGLQRYTICSDGSLIRKGGLDSVHGTISAHICADSGTVLGRESHRDAFLSKQPLPTAAYTLCFLHGR